jgi:hypothetical protein
MIYLILLSLFTWVAMLALCSDIDNPGALLFVLLMGLVYPLPVVLLLGNRIRRIAPVYVLLQVIHAILSILMMTAVSTNIVGDATAAGLLPAATFMVTASNEIGWESAVMLLCMVMGAGLVVVLLKARRIWASLRLLEPTAPELTTPSSADAS